MSAFKEGLRAFRRPKKIKGYFMVPENPYEEGSNKSKEWELGFNKAYFQNLEKVKQHESRARS